LTIAGLGTQDIYIGNLFFIPFKPRSGDSLVAKRQLPILQSRVAVTDVQPMRTNYHSENSNKY